MSCVLNFTDRSFQFPGKNLESVRRSDLPARRPEKLRLTSANFLNINELMAIKRCPYCRAIIDEKDQYCNNCGTQLLFPEDAVVEEDIKGEKIVDADVEEKDYEIPEPRDATSGTGAVSEEEVLEEDEVEPEEEVILIDKDKLEEGGERSPAELVPEEKAPEEIIAGMPASDDVSPNAAPGVGLRDSGGRNFLPGLLPNGMEFSGKRKTEKRKNSKPNRRRKSKPRQRRNP